MFSIEGKSLLTCAKKFFLSFLFQSVEGEEISILKENFHLEGAGRKFFVSRGKEGGVKIDEEGKFFDGN
jgi:hypothetical protein